MAPDLQPRRLTVVDTSTTQPPARDTATRLRHTWNRMIAGLATWHALDPQGPTIGADDPEWVWSVLRREGAYTPRRS